VTVTAAEVHFGGSAVAVPPYRVRYDGPRVLTVVPAGPGGVVTLPDARRLRRGGPIFTVTNRSATDSVAVVDAAAGAVATIPTGKAWDVYLLDNATAAGTWEARQRGTVTRGPAYPAQESWDLEIAADEVSGPQLRTRLGRKGWDGLTPVALRVTVLSGVTIGAVSGSPGLDTGPLPAGSTMLLIVRGRIAGVGGQGGAGAKSASNPGSAGGDGANGDVALRVWCDTAIDTAAGTIQGGGGGGGGGDGSYGGGGGGGGAGHLPPYGGEGGAGAVAGTGGFLLVGGAGGAGHVLGFAGGAGGGPGEAGESPANGGSGGAPGNAIERAAGAVVTIVAGGANIFGPQVDI